MLGEELEGSKYAGAVHVGKPFLNISEGEGFGTFVDGSIDEDAHGGRTDAMLLKDLVTIHHLLDLKD